MLVSDWRLSSLILAKHPNDHDLAATDDNDDDDEQGRGAQEQSAARDK